MQTHISCEFLYSFCQGKQDAAVLGIQLSFGIAVPPSRTAPGYVANLLEGKVQAVEEIT